MTSRVLHLIPSLLHEPTCVYFLRPHSLIHLPPHLPGWSEQGRRREHPAVPAHSACSAAVGKRADAAADVEVDGDHRRRSSDGSMW